MEVIGFKPDDTCNRNGCDGVIERRDTDDCSCHINPPCDSCTEPAGYCDKCGWEEGED